MTKIKREVIAFRDLTERQKDNILSYIQDKEISIRKASYELNVSEDTINRIFSQRYGKKQGCSETNRKQYFKQYWMKNKLK
jgi:lambda repressor-like predicted transcriptional regulator